MTLTDTLLGLGMMTALLVAFGLFCGYCGYVAGEMDGRRKGMRPPK